MVELNREFLVEKYGNDKLFELTEIDLRFKNITKVDPNTFKGLTKLERLALSDNEIEEIDGKAFESLSNLKWLRLGKNKLKEIDRKCFDSLKSIEMIELYENYGLKAVSFLKPSTKLYYHIEEVKRYGFLSDWNRFLQQFPQSGNLFLGYIPIRCYMLKKFIF